MKPMEPHAIPLEVMAELQESARRAAAGIHDPEVIRLACERMDRMREEIRQAHGVLNVGVDPIRDIRYEA